MTPIDYYFSFINYLSGFPWDAVLVSVRLAAIVVSGAASVLYFSAVRRLNTLPPEIPPITKEATIPAETVAKPWREIQEKMNSANPADWAVAVIQADAVLDQILKSSGYVGDTMGDRLKQVNHAELASIDDVWRAHRIRNRLAHETMGGLSRRDALTAIAGYEQAFRELNYIE